MVELETSRLLLRAVHIRDAGAFDEVFGDLEVMRFSSGTKTKAEVREWIQRCLTHYYPEWGHGPLSVVEKTSGEVIGYCGLFYFPNIDGRPEIEVGYRLRTAFWGKGFATEAALRVQDYAFSELGKKRLIAMVDPGNLASIGVALKLGMEYEKDVMLDGFTHPDRLYAREFTEI